MPRAIYKNAAGKRLPGCTTICAHLDADPGGLLHWANKGGLEGKTLDQLREAADVGTWTHARIEQSLGGELMPDSAMADATDEQRAQVETAFSAWSRWREANAPEIIATEQSLVSEALQFGGTLDHVLRIGCKVVLLDVKTGRLYPKALAQLAGYGILWHEAGGEPIAEYHLLRVGKDDGSLTWMMHEASSPTMAAADKAFRCAREIYELVATLKKAT